MTVKELKENPATFPDFTLVLVNGYKDGCKLIGKIWEMKVRMNVHEHWYEGAHDNTITNGISLCPNLHRAFDRGLIGIDENYRVIVSKVFVESDCDYSIKQFEKKEIV